MRSAAVLVLVVVLVVVLGGLGTVQAEEPRPAPAAERIAWFHRISDARKVATQAGRPLFVAIHVRPGVASPEATRRLERWIQVYADPAVVALSREFACVLRVIQAPEGKDPDRDTGPAAVGHEPASHGTPRWGCV